MSLLRTIVGRGLLKLPKATHPVVVDRDLPMTTSDGVVLLADRYHYGEDAPGPVLFMRTPYGRRGFMAFEGWFLAERGYQIVLQSCRGTFGSGGVFEPFRNEKRDGAEALAWIRQQPWCDGRVMTYGGSYCGITQWAALSAGADPQAMSLHVTSADAVGALDYPGGVFPLETKANWVHGLNVAGPEPLRVVMKRMRSGEETLRGAAESRSLADVDVICRGEQVGFWQEWINHEPGDPWWDASDCTDGRASSPAPVTSLGGWYDFFAPQQIADIVALQQRGLRPRLRFGPWGHPGGLRFRITDAMALFDETFRGTSVTEKPIQLQLCRDKQWLGFDSWPPPATPTVWHLRAGGELSVRAPGDEAADSYTYDPEDPTPSIGGTTLGKGSGPKDQVLRESRADVLTYTTAAFDRDVRVVGDLSCSLSLETSLAHSDVFVRLCHVDAKGVSTNLADGILRLTPDNGLGVAGAARVVPVAMFPVGVLVRSGERLRLQVSNGAHPLYARNWGTGEPLAKASTGMRCEVRVLHDASHPSTITLPVLSA